MTTPTTDETEKPTFDAMPLSDEVRRALVEMQYTTPTPVQRAVWEPVAAGKDVVVQARTGTGKTTAFGLPLIDRLIFKNKRQVQALVLCPTRELALQVAREVERLAVHTGISVVAVYGGAPMGRQIDALAGGAQLVAGTPGRVLDHLRRGTLDPSAIRALVLDEADEMLSMGFERELTAIIERLPPERQTLLFSATVPPDIERMARTRLREPEFVILSGDQVGALEINHFVYMVSQDKKGALVQLLDVEDPESAIIFCNTREETELVAQALARHGFEADWLNGDLPQSEREKVMRRTREGKLRFLVATDVAARGIDISHLTHVINYDFPQDAESYVHRTGRTGRAGRTGTAISLITPQDIGSLYILRLTYKIRPVERQLPSRGEERTRLEADLVRSLADTYVPRGGRSEDRALARRLLSHDDAERIIAGMLREHLAQSPELPEVAQSRRRGRTPPEEAPAPETPPTERREARRERRDDRGERRERRDRRDREERGEKREERGDKREERGEDPREGEEPRKRAERPPREARGEREERRARQERPAREARVERAESLEQVEVSVEDVAGDALGEGDARPRRRRRRRTRRAATGAPGDGEGEPGGDGEPSSEAAAEQAAPESDDDEAVETPRAPVRLLDRSSQQEDGEEDGPAADLVELHVDVGRRDGARARNIKSILADGGIAPEQVHRVRVRERYSFVEVDPEISDAAIEVLTGATVGERTLQATISQRSRA